MVRRQQPARSVYPLWTTVRPRPRSDFSDAASLRDHHRQLYEEAVLMNNQGSLSIVVSISPDGPRANCRASRYTPFRQLKEMSRTASSS